MDENLSRKIYIIGNGFDLNLGYPTRFKDFVDFCINWESFYNKPVDEKYVKGVNDTNIDKFKLNNKDGEQINQWDKINDLKLYVEMDESNELIALDYLIKKNGFIKYLSENKEDITYARWSDLENYLLELCEMCEEHEQLVLQNVEKINRGEKVLLNNEFCKFLDYINIPGSCYSKEGMNIGGRVKTLVKDDKIKFIKNMSDELQGFNKAFNIYLKCFINKMTLSQWKSNIYDNALVIDFNYTYFARKVFVNEKINYIHGYQHDNNIIIGINGDELNREYGLLTKEFMRLRLNVGNKQVSDVDVNGRYDSIEDFMEARYDNGVEIIMPTYVVVIGHSLNEVDWDILIEYFNDTYKYKKVIICYHQNYDNHLFNLYKMLKTNNVDSKEIDNRIKKGYYAFVKFDSLKDLLFDLNKNIENLSIHKYYDLDDKEEKVLKEIVKNQNELISGKKYLVSMEGITEDEMSDILENLNTKNYIKIKKGIITLNGPRRPYYITKILKY